MHRIRRLTLLVILALPAAPIGQSHGLPAPESVFSFRPGADYKLATYDQSISYFKKLAAATKSMTLIDAGRTSQGRTMYCALISTPENLAKIDRYREIARQLAVSKSGASVVARDLLQAGVARRVGSPGSRRVLYEASDTMEPIFEAQFGRVRATLPVLKRGEPHVPKGRARERFRAMVDLHEFWLREGAGIIDRWQKTRRKP